MKNYLRSFLSRQLGLPLRVLALAVAFASFGAYAQVGTWVFNSSAKTLTNTEQGWTLNNAAIADGVLSFGGDKSYVASGSGDLDMSNAKEDLASAGTAITGFSIGGYAFKGAAVTTLVIPHVTSIGTQAFDGCTSLTLVNLSSDGDLTLSGSQIFYRSTALSEVSLKAVGTIHLAAGSNDLFRWGTGADTATGSKLVVRYSGSGFSLDGEGAGTAMFMGRSTGTVTVYWDVPPPTGTWPTDGSTESTRSIFHGTTGSKVTNYVSQTKGTWSSVPGLSGTISSTVGTATWSGATANNTVQTQIAYFDRMTWIEPFPEHASWGYKITGLVGSDGGEEEALVFTNTAYTSDNPMTHTLPTGVTAIDYLVVGGGGGGGGAKPNGTGYSGGGGGAGGFVLAKEVGVSEGAAISITVGEGGKGGTGTSGVREAGDNGEDSLLKIGDGDSITAVGGGGGGNPSSSPSSCNGKVGGSGGGGGVTKGTGGDGTGGQGNAGGTATVNGESNVAGGGGGAGGVGKNGSADSDSGAGGPGLTAAEITGDSTTYYAVGGAGGKGGVVETTTDADPGTGNGGMGASAFSNTSLTSDNKGGDGGSGVVIIRYALPTTTTYTWNQGTKEERYWNYRSYWSPNTDYPKSTDSDIAAFNSDSLVTINTQPQAKRLDITSGRTVTLRLKDDYTNDRTITVADTTDLVTSGSRLVIKGNDSKKLTLVGTTSEWTGGNASDSYFSTLSAGSVLELANNAGYTGHLQFSTTTAGQSATIYAHDGENTVQDVRAYCNKGLLNVAVVDGSLTARNIAGNTTANNGGSTLVFGLTNATLSAANILGYDATDSKFTNLKFDIQLGDSALTAAPVVSASGTLDMKGATCASYGVNIDATRAPLGTYTILSAGTLSINGADDPLANNQQETSGWTITENASGTKWSWSVDVGEGRMWTLKREANDITLKIESAGTPITEGMISLLFTEKTYTGSSISAPSVTVNDGTRDLTLGTDYTLSGNEAKTAVDTYTITVTGMGDYTGSASKTWSITKATPDITGLSLAGWTYGETPNEPSASSTFGTVKYRYFDGEASMSKPTAATPPGTYKVQAYVDASDNWNATESAKVEFTISQASITGATVTVIPDSAPWTGAAHAPTVKVMLGGTDITAQCDLSWPPSGLTDVDTYTVTATAKSGGAYEGTATGSYEITKAQTTISGLRMDDFIGGREVPTPTWTVSPSGVPVDYTFWDNADCTGTEISAAELKNKPYGTYYVKATVEGTDNYTDATATASFLILDPESHKEEIPLPDPVTKPYNGKLQRSGIPETTYYTVDEPDNATDVTAEGYDVTLRVKEEYLKTHGFGSGEVKSSSATVKFYIVKGKNQWVTNPQLSPTYWYVSDDSKVTLNVGAAEFGDEFKTVKWYNRDKSEVIAEGAGNRPTAVGEYVLRIEVPGTDNYEVLAYEIGFIIYADLGKIQVPVPTVADQEYTGASQTANVPASDLWTMTCTAKQNVGTYQATLALKDPSKYVWRLANGTTSADNQTINWKIVKAKNEWTTVPQVTTTVSSRTYSIGTCAKGTAITVVDGVAKFGEVSKSGTIDTSSTDVKTRTYTVAGTSNYDGLTYTLTLRVGDSGAASASSLYWNANANGLWQDQLHWGNGTSGYPNDAAAVATFGTQCAGSNPIVVDSWEQIRLNQLKIDSGAASDITLNLHYSDTSKYDYKYSPYTDKSASALGVYLNGTDYVYTEPLSLTVADNKTLTLYDGKYFFKNGSSSLGEGATLRIRRPATVPQGSIGGNSAKIDFDLSVKPAASGGDYKNKTFTVGIGSTIEVDHAAAIFESTVWTARGWKVNAINGGICNISVTRTRYASADCGWEINIDNSIFYGNNMCFGMGATDALCDNPVIRISGEHGELYSGGTLDLGSSANVSQPLQICLTYPANGFSWGGFKWSYSGTDVANTLIGSPIGANEAISIGSNVKFTVDLSAYFAANPGVVTVPLVSANLKRTDGQYLNVPGSANGILADKTALADWYANGFTLKGVNKDEWELSYDSSVCSLYLRRKGAWDVDEDYMGFVWKGAVNGRWNDNSRWDVGRVPNLAKHTVRFNGTTSYPGYDFEPIEVDLENADWNIQLLNLAEPVNLKLKNGGLTVLDNTEASQPIRVRNDSRLVLDNVRLNSATTTEMGITVAKDATLVFNNSSFGCVEDPAKYAWSVEELCAGGEEVVFSNGTYRLCEFDRRTSGASVGEGKLRIVDATLQLRDGLAATSDLRIEVVGEGAQFLLGRECWQGRNYAYAYRWDNPQSWLVADGASMTATALFPIQQANINLSRMSDQLFVASNGVYNVGEFYLSDAKNKATEWNFNPAQCSGNEIRIYGERGAFRSTDSLYLGHDSNPDDAAKVTLALPAKGWAKAPLSAANTLAMRSKLKLNIDASAVKVTTTFPIASAATLTLNSNIYSSSGTHIGSNVTVTGNKDDCPYSFSQETADGVTTLYLTVEAGEQRIIELPTIASKVWTGALQTADVEESDDYEVVENKGGTNAGQYRVLLRLTDPEGTIWEGDDPSADRVLTFEITKVNNAWATMPSVDPQYWNENNNPQPGPGRLTPGVPTYGAVSVTHSANWDGSTMPMTQGAYWIRYDVPEGQNWTALSETVYFNVYAENVSPTGPKDGDDYEYIWARNGNGYWTMTDSWQGAAGATFGYPSCNTSAEPATYAIARFTAQHYLDGVTVRASQDITTGSIRFESGARPVTLDFGAKTLTLQNGVTVANADTDYAFANGTYNLGAVQFAVNNARIVADQGATVNVGALGIAGRLPTIVARNGGVFAYAGNLYLGATVSKTTYQAASLTAEGGTVRATGNVQLGTVVNEDIPALTVTVSGGAESGAGIETTGGTLTIGTASYDQGASPTVAITFPAGGFATAPIRTTGSGKAATVNAGVKFTLDVTKLEAGATLYKIVESAGTLTLTEETLAALKANATIKTKTGMKAELVQEGNVLGVKLTSLGLTLTLNPTTRPYTGERQELPAATVTDSDGNTVAPELVTLTYSVNRGEWKSSDALTDAELTEVGEIRVRATATGYDGNATATFTIAKPVYYTKTEGVNEIAVDPAVMKTLFGNDMGTWQTQFASRNAAGVAGWEAYVLGLSANEEWRDLTMRIDNGEKSDKGLSLSIPAAERSLLLGENKVAQRLVKEGGELGVTEVTYELIGGTKPEPDGLTQVLEEELEETVEGEGAKNPRSTPEFIYNPSKMGSVRFFQIRRRYKFGNQ